MESISAREIIITLPLDKNRRKEIQVIGGGKRVTALDAFLKKCLMKDTRGIDRCS